MESFLKELARQIYNENPQLDALTIVFPNRRAALYFRKHLSDIIARPAFAPTLITIEDFISSFSTAKIPDKLELVHRLHKTYNEVMALSSERSEAFDQFYFWGDMLLRDFDESDKYLVNVGQLFKDLRNQKELDSTFDYLTDQQRKFLLEFWEGFDENLTNNKRKFLEVWGKLFNVYQTFRSQLEAEGLAYEGMVHRRVAEKISSEGATYQKPAQLKFVGFNALTKAEEVILSYFVDHGSQIIWDADEYYVNNERQEAGNFFREYQKHKVLGKTFPTSFSSNFRKKKSVRVLGAAQPVGQAKLMGQVLEEELKKGMIPEETLIVLPDEKLLMPVLYGIPPTVDKLNVTMGYSLSNTSFFNLLELLVELQIGKRKDHFHHRQVLAILSHPYVIAADPVTANSKRKEILKHNWIHIPQSFLATTCDIHRVVFGTMDEGLLAYLTMVIKEIGSLESVLDLDKEYAFQFVKLINRVQQVMGNSAQPVTNNDKEYRKSLKSFLRLVRQLVRLQKIPFSGEPLKGLQIMGVLETRNLDFKNVFVLSLNEGAFPTFGGKGSYLPFNIRKAYGLPTTEYQDAIYAYLFYRVLQRAENVFLFYNTETDQLGQGEKSRYLQQLMFESGLEIEPQVLHNPVKPTPVNPIIIKKTQTVLEALAKLNTGTPRFQGISPSAINSYLECKLKFYFRYVSRIHEPNEVEDDMDARVLGNFVHKVMEKFYKNLAAKKRNNLVESGDFVNAESTIEKLMDEAFIDTYSLEPGKKIDYEGQSVVVRKMVKQFASKILEQDKRLAPFTIEAIEQEGLLHTMKINHAPGFAVIGGKIDRVDKKENMVRIVDYKTGGDSLEFASIEALFERKPKRNKAAFQTLLYAFLFNSNRPIADADVLIPGLIDRNYLFGDASDFGLTIKKERISDARPLLVEFKERLTSLLEEVFNPEEDFDQTTIVENCKFCPYKNICYR